MQPLWRPATRVNEPLTTGHDLTHSLRQVNMGKRSSTTDEDDQSPSTPPPAQRSGGCPGNGRVELASLLKAPAAEEIAPPLPEGVFHIVMADDDLVYRALWSKITLCGAVVQPSRLPPPKFLTRVAAGASVSERRESKPASGYCQDFGQRASTGLG